jgi:multiple sugar transport system substrate-binding protein
MNMREVLPLLKRGLAMLLFTMLLIQLAGCGGQTGEGNKVSTANIAANTNTATAKEEASKDPVTVTMLLDSGGNFTPEDLQKLFIDPVTHKYPYITLKLVQDDQNLTPEARVATNSLTDVLYIGAEDISTYEAMHAIVDLNPLVKKYNYDLNRLEPDMIEAIKKYGGSNGALYAIPFIGSGAALYYNKDLFNKFGVSYPKDGMIWDEVIELADKMGRKSDDPQLKFLDPGKVTKFSSSLGATYIDPKTNKAALVNDTWKRIFDVYKQIRTLPNNENIKSAKNLFTKDRKLAMYAYVNNVAQYVPLIKEGLNWDNSEYAFAGISSISLVCRINRG